MSTNDVPGAKKSNNDKLAMGCWAEHDDGSMILVESNEGSRVIYSIFDLSKDPPQEYRDSMPEKGFKKKFSFDGKNDKWTWHDKTPFDWDRVIGKGIPHGHKFAHVDHQLTAAERAAKSRNLSGEDVDEEAYDHLRDKFRGPAKKILDGIQELLMGVQK